MSGIEALGIVLGFVALIVTVIGFFASLKFYRDGVQTQNHVDAVLTKIEERSSATQAQIAGMFDKTLTAALGKTSSVDAEKQQTKVLTGSKPAIEIADGEPTATTAPPTSASGLRPGVGIASDPENGPKVLEFYALKKMSLTDISKPDSQAIFNLGGPVGFNLLNGVDGMVFLGFFVGLKDVEVVSRVRILFNNFERVWRRIEEESLSMVREMGQKLLFQFSIQLVISNSYDAKKVQQKIMEYQPAVRTIPISVYSLKDINAALEDEYRRMQPR